MVRALQYRRVVLTVRGSFAPEPAIRLAAELAHWLELELAGVFVEDEALLALAGHSFAREFSLTGHTWQTLDAERMLADFRTTAERTEHLLAEAASALGLPSAFSVLRADPLALAAQFPATDILVMVGPDTAPPPGEQAAPPPAAMMLVPPRPRLASGPIAAIPDDVSLAIAASLARGANEDLLLILPGSAEASLDMADLPPTRIRRRRVPTNDTATLARALRAGHARLLVIERSALRDDPAILVAASGTPVLIIGDGSAPEPNPE